MGFHHLIDERQPEPEPERLGAEQRVEGPRFDVIAKAAAVVGDGACFRQIEFVGILNGTGHEAEARQLVDFMLSKTFQEDIPLNMFVYPANETAVLPDVFAEYSLIPDNPATVSPADITANREAWIEAWTETVMR